MSHRNLTALACSLALVLASLSLPPASFADASGGGAPGGGRDRAEEPGEARDEVAEMFQRGMELVKEGKLEDALSRFENAHKKDKKNPDVLNMLAYTQRKLGKLDEAFENYKKALALRSRFPEAREYLGEAHIQAALQQIEVLRGYGDEGAEQLAKLSKALREAAASLDAEKLGQAAPSTHEKW
jgi:tetratricopeptide (TPR) repeat protein